MFDKSYQYQINTTITSGIPTSPLYGLSTSGDGIIICGSNVFYSTTAGLARTNFGNRHEASVPYIINQPWDQIQYLSVFSTSAVNLSLIVYKELS
jgi:hypothetical protein